MSFTTWQHVVALKELKYIAAEYGIAQQALIAEGINYVLAKYRRPDIAR
jgi:hypothetical protein